MTFIECQQIVKAYRVDDHEIVALRGIDFTMHRGEMVAIIGPSGAGKSSLLNLLGGLDTPTAGRLTVNGQALGDLKGQALAHYRLQQVGFVWQAVDQNLLAHRSAFHNVTLPMMLAGITPYERRRRAKDLLESVGLHDHLHKKPMQLSGGQQQRVAIAVALANHPQILLADEPTGALDHESAKTVMNLLMSLRDRYDLTVLMVTHDMKMATYADRVLTLRDGALGQDMSEQTSPQLDDEGRIQLPNNVRNQLVDAHRIAVEVRPEGVLLRPEALDDTDSDGLLQRMLPQDKTPEKQGLFSKLLGRFHNDREEANA